MIELAGIQNVDIDKLVDLVVKPETGGWQQFETGEWFESVEGECDRLLNRLGLIKNFGRMPRFGVTAKFRPDAGKRRVADAQTS